MGPIGHVHFAIAGHDRGWCRRRYRIASIIRRMSRSRVLDLPNLVILGSHEPALCAEDQSLTLRGEDTAPLTEA